MPVSRPSPSVPPTVSVVVPATRIDRHLTAALSSVLEQTLTDLEIVLVLDGVEPPATGSTATTGGSAPVALPVDDRLRVLTLPRRLGTSTALERGIAITRSALVARLDADDLAEPSRLERQVAFLLDHPEVVAVGTAATVVDETGRRIGRIDHPCDGLDRALLSRNVIVHSSAMVRRSALQRVGGYDARCVRMQDYDLWLRLATVGEVRNLPDALTSYRVHGGQASTNGRVRWLSSARVVLRSRRRLARHLGVPRAQQALRDALWLCSQLARHKGLRRPRYLSTADHDGVLVVKTVDWALDLMMRGQLARLTDAGLGPVHVAADDTGRLAATAAREGVVPHPVPMEREMAPLADLRSLLRLVLLLRRIRPALVVYGTPKASLLVSVAAWLTRVPTRVQILHCLRFETTSGPRRALLVATERIAHALSHRTIAVSHGVAERAADVGLDPRRLVVPHLGSTVGVDVEGIRSRVDAPGARERARLDHGSRPDDLVVGFVGRLTRDKGIETLVRAARALRDEGLPVRVVLVGPDEGVDELDADVRDMLALPWVHLTGNLLDPTDAYAGFDTFCLPSHREGLPTVVLEAWSAGVPVVTSDATGLDGTVDDGRTGLKAPVRDVTATATALRRTLVDDRLRETLVTDARRHVAANFDREDVWERCIELYRSTATETIGH